MANCDIGIENEDEYAYYFYLSNKTTKGDRVDMSEAGCRILSDNYNYNIKFMSHDSIRLGWRVKQEWQQ